MRRRTIATIITPLALAACTEPPTSPAVEKTTTAVAAVEFQPAHLTLGGPSEPVKYPPQQILDLADSSAIVVHLWEGGYLDVVLPHGGTVAGMDHAEWYFYDQSGTSADYLTYNSPDDADAGRRRSTDSVEVTLHNVFGQVSHSRALTVHRYEDDISYILFDRIADCGHGCENARIRIEHAITSFPEGVKVYFPGKDGYTCCLFNWYPANWTGEKVLTGGRYTGTENLKGMLAALHAMDAEGHAFSKTDYQRMQAQADSVDACTPVEVYPSRRDPGGVKVRKRNANRYRTSTHRNPVSFNPCER